MAQKSLLKWVLSLEPSLLTLTEKALAPRLLNFFHAQLNRARNFNCSLGLARLIEISVNRSIYKRKTIIEMKIKNWLLLMDVLFIYSIKIQA